jgi:hypothetical protein
MSFAPAAMLHCRAIGSWSAAYARPDRGRSRSSSAAQRDLELRRLVVLVVADSVPDLYEPIQSRGFLYKVFKYRLSEQVFSRQAGNDAHATVRCASALPDQSTGLFLCHCVLGTAHPSPRQARSSIDLVMLIAAPLRTVMKTLEPTLLVSTTACINLSHAADEHVRQPLFLQVDSLATNIVHDG